MNKGEFIKALAAKADISQKDAAVVYDAFERFSSRDLLTSKLSPNPLAKASTPERTKRSTFPQAKLPLLNSPRLIRTLLTNLIRKKNQDLQYAGLFICRF